MGDDVTQYESLMLRIQMLTLVGVSRLVTQTQIEDDDEAEDFADPDASRPGQLTADDVEQMDHLAIEEWLRRVEALAKEASQFARGVRKRRPPGTASDENV